jgi:AraC-like DNA-binding protein
VYYCVQSLSTRYGLKTQCYGFMDISFTSSGFDKLEMKLVHPSGFSGIPHLEERVSKQSTSWCNVMIKEQWFQGACILQSSIKADRACRLSISCENSYLLINFVLNGDVFAVTQENDNLAPLTSGHYNCLYCTNLNIEADIKQEQELSLFSVCMTRHYVKYRSGRSGIPDYELTNAKKVNYVACNKPITARLRAIMIEITSANQPQHIRRIYLEAKILEMLSLHLDETYIVQPKSSTNTVNTTDLPKLEQAKRLLESSIESNFSLIEIARKIGLNDFKLKKGFKATYGFTVFGYLTELRMAKAKELLLKGLPVSEVADTVGYKNPQYFTSKFKKRFNVLPSKV